MAEITHITEEEDRISGGIWYPVGAFIEAARSIPAFDALLRENVDLPSLWSIMRHMGLWSSWDFPEVAPCDDASLSPELLAYRIHLALRMNGSLTAKSCFVVTTPRPPLEAGAGILAIYAERPSNPAKRVLLEMVASARKPR